MLVVCYLQEGFRYNALHVSAKFNKVEMCQEILEILDDPSFYQLMYPQDTPQTRAERINFLVDLYLNMPDKGVGAVHRSLDSCRCKPLFSGFNGQKPGISGH